MTYRQALRIQIKALNEIYNNAEALRDCTDYESLGKDAWNLLRGRVSEVTTKLRQHDRLLTDKQANEQINGDYSITLTTKDI